MTVASSTRWPDCPWCAARANGEPYYPPTPCKPCNMALVRACYGVDNRALTIRQGWLSSMWQEEYPAIRDAMYAEARRMGNG